MEKLIQRCQQGDRESMGQLYTAMHDELLAHCRKFVANNIAEDLLHDAFLLIFSNISKLRSPEKGRQWMHKVVQNVCLLYVQHRQDHIPIDDIQETVQRPDPEIPFTYNELLNAIDQLPRGYRQVFRLSVLEGLTHQQIAGLLGIEPHTSSSQLMRAKRQLRQWLQVLMLLLLAAIPLGGYYFWASRNSRHDVAERSEKTPSNTVADTTVCLPATEMLCGQSEQGSAADHIKKATKQEQGQPCPEVVEHEPIQPMAKAEEGIEQGQKTVVTENDRTEMNHEAAHIVHNLPSSANHSKLALSLAYSGLPNSNTRQLPFGTEGMNGDIDSVTHYRLPITVALSARYCLNSHWWLDGGLRFTWLSSETRVGNTYSYIEQQQHIRYLGLSLGVGYHLWHRQRWSLYATTSVCCELPLHSTAKTSYWQGERLIDVENNQLTSHTQWSIGMGMGLQYNLTPTVGFFVEPSLQYYFHNTDEIKTWHTEHPLTPMLPLGIRVSF